jgi:ADP-heptose:LPS heptosyltransferase
VKENDPRIEITWVVRSRFEPLVRARTAVDRTVIFYRARGTAEFANFYKN